MVAGLKGVLLCGGEGTRLRPFTEVVNKHLVRVHNLPMAEYPLRKMIEAGCDDILIVSGGDNFAAVVKYFGSGSKWGINIMHAIQDKAGGIAQALALAKNFVGENKVMVCLGDNIWSMSIREEMDKYRKETFGTAMFFTIKSSHPERFGVIKFDGHTPVDVIEKPAKAPSPWILAGIYAFGPEVFDIIKTLHPSARGELEIADVNRFYIKAGFARIVEMDGWWSDCGSLETLLKTEEYIKND